MNKIRIIDFQPGHQPYFEQLNRAWIDKYFTMEDIDRFVLMHPQEAIIDPGGCILMALYNEVIAGTVALKKVNADVIEFTKMAVDENFRRKGIAEALCNAAFRKAIGLGASKVILYSQTILAPAIHLYHKLGFHEVTLEPGVYKRADIMMEINLDEIIAMHI